MSTYSRFNLNCSMVLALGLAGCATSATAFRPEDRQPDETVLIGRIEVGNEGRAMTDDCTATFADLDRREESRFKLDASGWFFAHLKPGRTRLTRIFCATGNFFHSTAELDVPGEGFELPVAGKIGYFGNARVEVAYKKGFRAWALLGPLGYGFMRAEDHDFTNSYSKVTLEDQVSEAQAEYQRRYGSADKSVQVVADLAAPRIDSATRAPASSAAAD